MGDSPQDFPSAPDGSTEPAWLPARSPLASISVVERVASRDLPELVDFYRALAEGPGSLHGAPLHPPHVAARLARLLAQGGLFGIRGPDGRWQACFGLADRPAALWQPDASAWYLEKLAVRPGAEVVLDPLLAWLERRAAAQGADFLRTDCDAEGLAPLRFWQTRGYRPVRTVTDRAGRRTLHEKRVRPLRGPGLAVRALGDALAPPAFPGALRATLLFVVTDARVLLIHKKRGHGAGRINGPGGKLDPGETPRACAVRETREELGIDVLDPVYAGELRFLEADGSRIHGFVFRASRFEGEPVETDEAVPLWCATDAVPFARMWPDDRMWLPWLLRGEGFRAAFLTDDGRVEAAQLALGPVVEPEFRGQDGEGEP
jgi:8-oxo-dGTP diphosphatase